MDFSSILIGILFSIAITMQIFQTDEKRQIHLLFNSLPYTRKELVSAKYLGACVITLLVLLTIIVGKLIIRGEWLPWKEITMVACIFLLFYSLFIPFSYMFSSKYIMYASIALFALYLVTINVFIPNLNDIIREIVGKLLALEQFQVYAIVGSAIFGLYFLSWLLSIRIYQKKVF